MMSLWDALRMNMMISYQELVRTFPNKKREPLGSRYSLTQNLDYMFAIIASPNSEHFSSLAPSIRRSKS